MPTAAEPAAARSLKLGEADIELPGRRLRGLEQIAVRRRQLREHFDAADAGGQRSLNGCRERNGIERIGAPLDESFRSHVVT
jgi:hypothetical protein